MAGSSEFGPEDWIASATPRFGRGDDGPTTMPDGRYLSRRHRHRCGELAWAGTRRVLRSDPALLVGKLLDAGQRLPVHVHPDRAFAVSHLRLAPMEKRKPGWCSGQADLSRWFMLAGDAT